MDKANELLKAMESPCNVELLYDIWQIVKAAPSRAAEILVQFKDVSSSARIMVAELETTMSRFMAVKDRVPEIASVAEALTRANKGLVMTDDKALNRLNRIIDAAEKLRELKVTGALDVLKSL
jgi:DNA repair ATPase RecN